MPAPPPDGAAPRAQRPRSPLSRLLLPVYAPTLIWSTGAGALAPVMVLAALSLGYTPSLSSALAGVSGLVGVLTGPSVGRAITRTGDRVAFIVGTVMAVVSLGTTLVALDHPGKGWAQVVYLVGMVALAVSGNIWSLARQSYVVESVPLSWRARAMSMMGGMLRLGTLIGPAAGSLAIAWWGLPGSFWLQIATTLVALALVLAFVVPAPEALADTAPTSPMPDSPLELASVEDLPVDGDEGRVEGGGEGDDAAVPAAAEEPPLTRLPLREKADTRATVLLAAGVVLLALVRTNRTVVIPLWGHALGISDHAISATFAAAAVMDTLMFYPAGRLMDSRGRRWALIPTMVIMGMGFLSMAVWTTPTGFFVTACLIGFGNGFGAGIVMTMGADLSPDVDRSTFLGVWQSIGQIGSTAGPFMVSALVALFGVASSVWVTGAISLFGVVWFALTVPHAYARLGIDDRGRGLTDTP